MLSIFKKDLQSFPNLHPMDCPTRHQISVNQISNPHREPTLDHRPATNLPAATYPNIHDNDGLLPLATPMPSVITNNRY